MVWLRAKTKKNVATVLGKGREKANTHPILRSVMNNRSGNKSTWNYEYGMFVLDVGLSCLKSIPKTHRMEIESAS